MAALLFNIWRGSSPLTAYSFISGLLAAAIQERIAERPAQNGHATLQRSGQDCWHRAPLHAGAPTEPLAAQHAKSALPRQSLRSLAGSTLNQLHALKLVVGAHHGIGCTR